MLEEKLIVKTGMDKERTVIISKTASLVRYMQQAIKRYNVNDVQTLKDVFFEAIDEAADIIEDTQS